MTYVRSVVLKVRRNVKDKGEPACDDGEPACDEGESFWEFR